MKLRLGILIMPILTILILGACESKLPAAPQAAGPNSIQQVEIKLFTFKPQFLEVPVGTTVVWTNRDAVEHTVTNGTPEKPSGTFDSEGFTEGKTFSFTFTKEGEYPYFCKRHNFMQGVVKVVPVLH